MSIDLNPAFIAGRLGTVMSNCPGIHEFYAGAIWVLALVHIIVLVFILRNPTRLAPMLVLGGHVPLAVLLLPIAVCTPFRIDPSDGYGLFLFYGQSAWVAAGVTIFGLILKKRWIEYFGLGVSLSWPLFVMYVITLWPGFA